MKKRTTRAVICAIALLVLSSPSLATEPHEDPAIARLEFSGISLFRYFSGSLDFVLQKEPAEVETSLEKMPFANVPQNLEEPVQEFATAGINIAFLVAEIDEDMSKFRVLLGQFRLKEAMELAIVTAVRISQAYSELNCIEQATETTGKELRVSSTPEGSSLRQSYDELLERIDRIREMLELYQKLLESTGVTIEELLELTGMTIEELLELTGMTIEELMESTSVSVEELMELSGLTIEELLESTGVTIIEELLKMTRITLQVRPTSAFVGDNVTFEGRLTSEGEPLAGREVDILLNSSPYITAKTDAYGYYQGRLPVPYWYIPELELQALYYPREKDKGLYLASLSPEIKLTVLFYKADLEIEVEDKAYPGLETVVTGKFDYGQSPSLSQRKVEIYFDNVLITEIIAGEKFTQEIEVDAEVDMGIHTITISALPAKRYSPVLASATLDVTRAIPILDMAIPNIAMIPGKIGLDGTIYSEVGPLNEAAVEMRLGSSRVEFLTSKDGSFDTKIGMGMGLSLIGTQDLVIQVLPEEPWHAPLVTARSLVVINMVNCGSIFIVLVLLGVFLPRKFKRRLGVHLRRRTETPAPVTRPEPAPTYSRSVLAPVMTEESDQPRGKPVDRIFYWYRFVVRTIQAITRILLKPQQTLREFARESSKVLGPAARYFIELTRMVERLLYSRHKPTEEDAEKSQQLSHNIAAVNALRRRIQR